MTFITRAKKRIQRRAATAREKLNRRKFPKAVQRAWSNMRAENLSYTTDSQLHQLIEQVCNTADSNALIIETGCARGGAAILMCAAKASNRPMHVYDMFDMIPPPSDNDGPDMKSRYQEIASGEATGIDGGLYYLYENDLKAIVEDNFSRFGYPPHLNSVKLVKGDIVDTLRISEPVALAHVDVDWYEPVSAALKHIVPHLIPGGAIVLHAYYDWSGCRKATDEYFNRVGREGFQFDGSAGHMMVTHTPS